VYPFLHTHIHPYSPSYSPPYSPIQNSLCSRYRCYIIKSRESTRSLICRRYIRGLYINFLSIFNIFLGLYSFVKSLISNEFVHTLFKEPANLAEVQQDKLGSWYKEPLPIKQVENIYANLDLRFLPAVTTMLISSTAIN
jgi:hypothetical protein